MIFMEFNMPFDLSARTYRSTVFLLLPSRSASSFTFNPSFFVIIFNKSSLLFTPSFLFIPPFTPSFTPSFSFIPPLIGLYGITSLNTSPSSMTGVEFFTYRGQYLYILRIPEPSSSTHPNCLKKFAIVGFFGWGLRLFK